MLKTLDRLSGSRHRVPSWIRLSMRTSNHRAWTLTTEGSAPRSTRPRFMFQNKDASRKRKCGRHGDVLRRCIRKTPLDRAPRRHLLQLCDSNPLAHLTQSIRVKTWRTLCVTHHCSTFCFGRAPFIKRRPSVKSLHRSWCSLSSFISGGAWLRHAT